MRVDVSTIGRVPAGIIEHLRFEAHDLCKSHAENKFVTIYQQLEAFHSILLQAQKVTNKKHVWAKDNKSVAVTESL